RGVSDLVLDAYDHQGPAPQAILQAADIRSSRNRAPLIEAMFNFDRTRPRQHWPDLIVTHLEHPTAFTKFDVTLNVTEVGDSLVCEWEYNTDLFDVATVRQWLRYYEHLLRAMAAGEGRAVELPLLDPNEHAELVGAWHETR